MTRRILSTGFALALLLALASPALAQNILVLNQQCNASTAYFPQALADAGLAFTEVNDVDSFAAELGGPTLYDVVIVDEYNSTLGTDAQIGVYELVRRRGGCAFINYWAWYNALPEFNDAFGVGFVSDYTTPVPIFPWNAASPLYTTPNAIGTLTPNSDTCDRDGARFAETHGTAIGGYTGAPTANEAGFVVANGGRTVLYGGITGLLNGDADVDTTPDGAELAQNVVAYLEAQGCMATARGLVDVPTLSPSGIGAFGVALAALALVALGRRRRRA